MLIRIPVAQLPVSNLVDLVSVCLALFGPYENTRLLPFFDLLLCRTFKGSGKFSIAQSGFINHAGIPNGVQVGGFSKPGYANVIASAIIAIADVQRHMKVPNQVNQDKDALAFFGRRE